MASRSGGLVTSNSGQTHCRSQCPSTSVCSQPSQAQGAWRGQYILYSTAPGTQQAVGESGFMQLCHMSCTQAPVRWINERCTGKKAKQGAWRSILPTRRSAGCFSNPPGSNTTNFKGRLRHTEDIGVSDPTKSEQNVQTGGSDYLNL